jgi:predicted dehydrogenase
VAEALGARPFPTLESLLDEVEALIVVTPTSTHRDVAVAALRRGIHVFIEKPIAPSLEEADQILEAAREGGALVQVGHVERFNSAVVGRSPIWTSPSSSSPIAWPPSPSGARTWPWSWIS